MALIPATHCLSTVFIAESGAYEERGVDGVFSSVAAAIKHYGGTWTRELWLSTPDTKWHYYQIWARANADIVLTPHILDAPSANPAAIAIAQPYTLAVKAQVYNEVGGWDYVSVSHDVADRLLATRGLTSILKMCRDLGLSTAEARVA